MKILGLFIAFFSAILMGVNANASFNSAVQHCQESASCSTADTRQIFDKLELAVTFGAEHEGFNPDGSYRRQLGWDGVGYRLMLTVVHLKNSGLYVGCLNKWAGAGIPIRCGVSGDVNQLDDLLSKE